MNSNKRKSGGAYRLKKRSVSLHANAGKDRSKSRQRVHEQRWWTAHIDREKWTAEWVDNDQGEGMMCKCSKCGYPVSYFWGKTAFCPGCGRAMTPEAWEELACVTAERDAIKKNPPVEIQADAFVLAVELAKVTAERDAAVEDLKKWNVCATCENYRPKSRTSNCKIKKAYLSGGNWAGCSRWEWRGPQKEATP